MGRIKRYRMVKVKGERFFLGHKIDLGLYGYKEVMEYIDHVEREAQENVDEAVFLLPLRLDSFSFPYSEAEYRRMPVNILMFSLLLQIEPLIK